MANQRNKAFDFNQVHRFIEGLFDTDMHTRRVYSLGNATLGVMTGASLAVATIGHSLAEARGLRTKHAVKQVDRLLANGALQVTSPSMAGWPRWPDCPCTPAGRAGQRRKLERLCRYISRPAIAEQRLSLTPKGDVRYQLKTPYRDGTTHFIFAPLEFIASPGAESASQPAPMPWGCCTG